jgi:hypothetical protein
VTGKLSKLGGVLMGQHLNRRLPQFLSGTLVERREDSASVAGPECVPLRPRPANLASGLSRGTARLTVTRDHLGGAEVFGLIGSCCCGVDLAYTAPPTQARPHRLSLGSLISSGENGESPAETFMRMRSWSTHMNQALHLWLTRLRRAHGDDFQLIICDVTDFDLPWELLWLKPVQSADLSEGWLGAIIPVTRSTTAIERRQADVHQTAVTQCKGDIAAYIHQDMSRDRSLFDQFSTQIWDSSLDELLAHLDEPGAPLALVYVACHGSYPEATQGVRSSGAKIKLIDHIWTRDTGQTVHDGLTVRDLDWRNFRRISDSGGVIFLNACHSGRLAFDPEINDDTLRGFAEVFLRSGASGVIGTSGAIGKEHGHEAARDLLDQIYRQPGLPVAVALRNYRRRIADATPQPSRSSDDGTARLLFSLFFSFMYVYFGWPDTTIHLVTREGMP